MVEFVSANPTGPMHVGHGRGAAYGATLGNLLEATGHTRLSRVLHQRCRPADRHPRGQRLPAISRARGRERDVSRRTAIAPTTSCPWRARCTRNAATRSGGPRPTSRAARRPMRPPGDKDKHIDGLIENARRLLGAAEFDSIVIFARDADDGRHPQRPRRVRRALRPLVFRARAQPERRHRPGARRVARQRPRLHQGRRRVVQVHRVRRRRRSRGGARERREDLLRLRHRLSLRQAPARPRSAHRRLGCGPPRLRGARARRAGRARQPRRLLRGLPHAAREPVPRRREARRWASARATS